MSRVVADVRDRNRIASPCGRAERAGRVLPGNASTKQILRPLPGQEVVSADQVVALACFSGLMQQLAYYTKFLCPSVAKLPEKKPLSLSEQNCLAYLVQVLVFVILIFPSDT